MNEVKRQAMSELQKAVSEAERKAHEMISSERAKMERTVAEAKRQAAEDALSIINQQEDSSEVRADDSGNFQERCPQSVKIAGIKKKYIYIYIYIYHHPLV